MGKTNFKIKVDWLDVTVHVYFVDDAMQWRNEDLIKKFPKLEKSKFSEAYAMHTYDVDAYPFDRFIILNKRSNWGTIAHECYHCAKNMLEYNDIKNEEATAHLLEYLVTTIQGKIKTKK
jgi:hypothetical protein